MPTSFSHVGICASDWQRSLRFYTEALGFEKVEYYNVDYPELGQLMELDAPKVHSQFITRGGIKIELLGFDAPAVEGDGSRRRMNQLGLTHLSLYVDDLDEVTSKIEELGGSIVEPTRTTLGPAGDYLFCTDPDGTRIELMKAPT